MRGQDLSYVVVVFVAVAHFTYVSTINGNDTKENSSQTESSVIMNHTIISDNTLPRHSTANTPLRHNKSPTTGILTATTPTVLPTHNHNTNVSIDLTAFSVTKSTTTEIVERTADQEPATENDKVKTASTATSTPPITVRSLKTTEELTGTVTKDLSHNTLPYLDTSPPTTTGYFEYTNQVSDSPTRNGDNSGNSVLTGSSNLGTEEQTTISSLGNKGEIKNSESITTSLKVDTVGFMSTSKMISETKTESVNIIGNLTPITSKTHGDTTHNITTTLESASRKVDFPQSKPITATSVSRSVSNTTASTHKGTLNATNKSVDTTLNVESSTNPTSESPNVTPTNIDNVNNSAENIRSTEEIISEVTTETNEMKTTDNLRTRTAEVVSSRKSQTYSPTTRKQVSSKNSSTQPSPQTTGDGTEVATSTSKINKIDNLVTDSHVISTTTKVTESNIPATIQRSSRATPSTMSENSITESSMTDSPTLMISTTKSLPPPKSSSTNNNVPANTSETKTYLIDTTTSGSPLVSNTVIAETTNKTADAGSTTSANTTMVYSNTEAGLTPARGTSSTNTIVSTENISINTNTDTDSQSIKLTTSGTGESSNTTNPDNTEAAGKIAVSSSTISTKTYTVDNTLLANTTNIDNVNNSAENIRSTEEIISEVTTETNEMKTTDNLRTRTAEVVSSRKSQTYSPTTRKQVSSKNSTTQPSPQTTGDGTEVATSTSKINKIDNLVTDSNVISTTTTVDNTLLANTTTTIDTLSTSSTVSNLPTATTNDKETSTSLTTSNRTTSAKNPFNGVTSSGSNMSVTTTISSSTISTDETTDSSSISSDTLSATSTLSNITSTKQLIPARSNEATTGQPPETYETTSLSSTTTVNNSMFPNSFTSDIASKTTTGISQQAGMSNIASTAFVTQIEVTSATKTTPTTNISVKGSTSSSLMSTIQSTTTHPKTTTSSPCDKSYKKVLGSCRKPCVDDSIQCGVHGRCYITEHKNITSCICKDDDSLFQYSGKKCEVKEMKSRYVITVAAGSCGGIILIILFIVCGCWCWRRSHDRGYGEWDSLHDYRVTPRNVKYIDGFKTDGTFGKGKDNPAYDKYYRDDDENKQDIVIPVENVVTSEKQSLKDPYVYENNSFLYGDMWKPRSLRLKPEES